jgi:uncharacterized membrane protein YccC
MARVHDDGWRNLRKGLRAAIVVPGLYAVLGGGIGTTAALYGAFASFSALVFADFQGTARRTLEGYAALAGLGAGLILVGSATADVPVAPAVAIFVVTFAIRFAGCLGGYAVAAGTTLMLAFALAVMSTPVVAVDQRVAGWLLGCAAAAVAALVAPVPPRLVSRERLAPQARAVAARLRALARGAPAPEVEVAPVRAAREELDRSSSHPVVATAGQTALLALVDALGRASLVVQHVPDGPLDRGGVGTDHVAEAAADTFDATADVLLRGAPVDLAPVHDALVEQRRATVEALSGSEPDRRHLVEEDAPTAMRVRFAAALATVAAAAAATWAGHRPTDEVRLEAEELLPRAGVGPTWARARRTLGFHLRWQSTRFRNSLRAGVALAASLAVARLVDFDHGFWVVLGTLMVLRSGVADTTTTALQALRGTLIGFAVAVPIAYAAHGGDTLLWLLLPLTTFLAAWVPGAVGLGSGQAAFTVFVVVLFDLAAPSGTQTAVIRLETVATGIAVAVAAGFLFWPRGPETSLGPITARLYRAAARTVQAVSGETLGLPSGREGLAHARHELAAARDELEETFEELAADRRATVALTDRVAMMTPPSLVRAGDWARADLAGGSIDAAEGAPTARPVDLEAQAFEVASRFEAVASWLDDPDEEAVALRRREPPPPRATGLDGPQFLRQVWLWSWLTTVDESLLHTQEDTVRTVRQLPRHWWR